ncbi:MAG: ADP-ribosylglycohydrolase family protein [Alphaproteobacteria bacterium]
MPSLDKIKGCFLLGACGDALGAPIELMKNLNDIINKYGEEGLTDIIPFTNAYGNGVDYPAGRLTDDTTMTMATVSAMIKAGKQDIDTLRPLLWQAWINWCSHQDNSEGLKDKVDTKIDWDANDKAFWFKCGAGAGTIAALSQEKWGTVAEPVTYDCVIRGKQVKGPNLGCGGMMRVAPLALLDLKANEIFELACESAAITHGHPEGYTATGATALLIHFAAKDMDMKDAVAKTIETMQAYAENPLYKDGVAIALKALNHAQTRAAEEPHLYRTIDALPAELGYTNAFLATPVLAQTAYALLSAPAAKDAKAALCLAANHSGDSDSVAAIVGNVLGARHGVGAVPKEYLDALIQKDDIATMAERLSAALAPAAPQVAPARKNPAP